MAGESTGASFRDFLKAFGKDWFTRMCGPASVPLALAAPFVPGRLYKTLLALLAIGCGLLSSYWVWRTAQLEINRLKVRPYNSAQLGLVRERIVKLGADERDVLRYLVQFGEREQSRIFADSGIPDAQFGTIFTTVSRTNLLNRDEQQKGGRAGIDLYWRINPQFAPVLEDELFPRHEETPQRCFLQA